MSLLYRSRPHSPRVRQHDPKYLELGWRQKAYVICSKARPPPSYGLPHVYRQRLLGMILSLQNTFLLSLKVGFPYRH